MNAGADGAGVLHLLLNLEQETWKACSACCTPRDTVLLIDQGVMGLACSGAIPQTLFPCRVAASSVDASARGLPIGQTGLGIEFVDDSEVIELIEAHAQCLSWR